MLIAASVLSVKHGDEFLASVEEGWVSIVRRAVEECSLAASFDSSCRLLSATWRLAPENYLGPAFYRGTLKAGFSPKDTFLDLSVSTLPLLL